MTSSSDVLYNKLSRFAAYLRKQGMKVGLSEIQDAVRALNMTGFEDRETVKAVLRSLYAKSMREQNVFDQCFDVFFVSEEEFRRMCDNGELFESTMYAHHSYGSKRADVERILAEGKHVLTVMDICGAMSLKTLFPHVVTIFVKRDRRELIKDILLKESTVEDKANRLLSIEVETRNTEICDYTVKFDYCDQAVDEICRKLQV